MSRQSALPGFGDSNRTGPGPVYQGVAAQIRAMFPASDDDEKARKSRALGTISQARSLAAAIDRASGHGGHRLQSGVSIAAMHDQLDKLLAKLSEHGDSDPFDELIRQAEELERQERERRAAQSHGP